MTVNEPSIAAEDRDRLPVILAYGLFLLAVTNGVTMLIGFIIALVRRGQAQGTIYESHYRNLIIVFFVMTAFAALVMAGFFAGLLGLLSAAFNPYPWGAFAAWFPMPVLLLPVAVLASFLLGLWYLWRVIGGFIRLLEDKPY